MSEYLAAARAVGAQVISLLAWSLGLSAEHFEAPGAHGGGEKRALECLWRRVSQLVQYSARSLSRETSPAR